MLKEITNDAENRMKGALVALEEDLTTIRTGRATPALVEKLPIDYFGMPTPLLQLATISIPEARAILIKPFDPTTLRTIERSILASDLGLTPNNDGKAIRLNLPPLTQERRRDLVKVVSTRLEEARVAIRNIRRTSNENAKKLEKKGIPEDMIKKLENDIQEMTNNYINKVDKLLEVKEKDIMTV